jgi:hypothetical protein
MYLQVLMNLMAIRECQIFLINARIGRWDKLWLSCQKLIFLNIVNRMYGNTEVFLVHTSFYQSLQSTSYMYSHCLPLLQDHVSK